MTEPPRIGRRRAAQSMLARGAAIVAAALIGCQPASESTTSTTSAAEQTNPQLQSAPPPAPSGPTLATHGGLELRYEFAREARQKDRELTVRIVERRLEAAGADGAQVRLDAEELVVQLVGPVDVPGLKAMIAPRAKLTIARVDDDADPWPELAKAKVLPEGLTLEREAVSVGPDKSSTRTFVQAAGRPGEPAADVLSRLRAWTEAAALPPDRRVGFELQDRRDGQDPPRWRTYVVHRAAALDGAHIENVSLTEPDFGGLRIVLELDDEGRAKFERLTKDAVKRRLAIMVDDRVESAPLVQEKISGGRVAIAMGGDPADLRPRTERLMLQLRSGALPSPLVLKSENLIGPAP